MGGRQASWPPGSSWCGSGQRRLVEAPPPLLVQRHSESSAPRAMGVTVLPMEVGGVEIKTRDTAGPNPLSFLSTGALTRSPQFCFMHLRSPGVCAVPRPRPSLAPPAFTPTHGRAGEPKALRKMCSAQLQWSQVPAPPGVCREREQGLIPFLVHLLLRGYKTCLLSQLVSASGAGGNVPVPSPSPDW